MEGSLWRPSGCPAARLDNLPKGTFISNIGSRIVKPPLLTNCLEDVFSETWYVEEVQVSTFSGIMLGVERDSPPWGKAGGRR
jgi:hypothetical protein